MSSAATTSIPRPQIQRSFARAGTTIELLRAAIAELHATQRELRTPYRGDHFGAVPPVLLRAHASSAERLLLRAAHHEELPEQSRAHAAAAATSIAGASRPADPLAGGELPSTCQGYRPATNLVADALAHARRALAIARGEVTLMKDPKQPAYSLSGGTPRLRRG